MGDFKFELLNELHANILPRMTRPTNKLRVTVTNVENFCEITNKKKSSVN